MNAHTAKNDWHTYFEWRRRQRIGVDLADPDGAVGDVIAVGQQKVVDSDAGRRSDTIDQGVDVVQTGQQGVAAAAVVDGAAVLGQGQGESVQQRRPDVGAGAEEPVARQRHRTALMATGSVRRCHVDDEAAARVGPVHLPPVAAHLPFIAATTSTGCIFFWSNKDQ